MSSRSIVPSRTDTTDWRKRDESGGSTPRERGSGVGVRRSSGRREDRDREPPFLSREDKLVAMEGVWKQASVPPRQQVERRVHHREQRDPYREPHERRELREPHERREPRDDLERREPRDHRDRDYTRDRQMREPRGQGRLADDGSNSNWGGGDVGGGKGRPKEVYLDSGDEFKCCLVNKGAERLNAVLNKEFQVCPRQDVNSKVPGCGALPTLSVQAAYLISYVVENLVEDADDGQDVHVQVYGGEARAIVAAEYDVEDQKSRPTDLDLRFKIGGKSFESCRDVVERFLHGRLVEKMPHAESSLIRQCYFQKQVVVGSDFSLLSIGDPATGRNLDLEFTGSKCEARCFFDAANAFVIPLPDPAHYGWRNIKPPPKRTSGSYQEGVKLLAVSQSAPWRTAVNYIRKGELSIDKPETVFNGLPLYAHALSDKQLTPGTRELEHEYGAKFAGSFLEQAEATCKQHQDPLRFIKSFLRSHYPSRPVNALACLSQLLAVLRAHAVLDDINPERQAISKNIADTLAELCREALKEALDRDAVDKVLQIVRFAAYPFTAAKSVRRDEVLWLPNRQSIRLRRQLPTTTPEKIDSPLWEEVCKHAAEALTEKLDQYPDPSKRAEVEAVCEALTGLQPEDSDESDHDQNDDDQSSDDEGTDKQSAVASSKSMNSIYNSCSGSSSTTPSRDGRDDEAISTTSARSEDHDLDESGISPHEASTGSSPGISRKSPQVQVKVDKDSLTPASPAPAATAGSPRTPGSTSSKTPTSERRRTPMYSQPYRPPGRRSDTPKTPN